MKGFRPIQRFIGKVVTLSLGLETYLHRMEDKEDFIQEAERHDIPVTLGDQPIETLNNETCECFNKFSEQVFCEF